MSENETPESETQDEMEVCTLEDEDEDKETESVSTRACIQVTDPGEDVGVVQLPVVLQRELLMQGIIDERTWCRIQQRMTRGIPAM